MTWGAGSRGSKLRATIRAPRCSRGRVAAILLVWAAGACGGGMAGVEEVPEPRLDRVEPAVRQQLEQKRAVVEEALDDGAEAGELARAFGDLGAAYHLYFLRDPAVVAYGNARRLDPREPRWAYYQGLLYRDLGRFEEAAEAFDAALQLSPDYLPARIQRAEVDLLANRPGPAAEGFRQALALVPGSAAALYGLGRAQLALGDAAGAAEALEKALDLEPAAGAMRYPLALAYRKLGRGEDAAREMAARTADGPGLDDPWWAAVTAEAAGAGLLLKRGGLASVAGNLDTALEAYRAAVEANPESAAARQSLGSALARVGDWPAARRELEAALALDPDNPVVLSNLGQVLLSSGEVASARRHLERAVALDPRRFEARLELASLLVEEGRPAEALTQVDAILAVDASNDQARRRRQELLISLGRLPEALAAARSAVAAAPSSFEARFELASVLSAGGDGAGAEATLLESLELAASDQERGRARLALAQLAQARGRQGQAEEQYRAALTLDPDLDAARFYLASLVARGGRYAEAAELFAEVRRRQPGQVAAWLAEATARALDGRPAAAQGTLEEGLAAQPESSAAAFELGHALARLLASGEGDGARAVELAEAAFAALSTTERGETLAMAYAAAGRFAEAEEWQQRLIEAARSEGDDASLRRLEINLERYRQGRRGRLEAAAP